MLQHHGTAQIVDAILLLVAVEATALLLLWRWRRIGIPPRRLLPTLLAGGCLLMALRAFIAGASWHSPALWLALSLVAHLADIAGRWQSRPQLGDPGLGDPGLGHTERGRESRDP